MALSPRFNFIGNIDVGKDLPLSSFPNNYDAILFAYGASTDRKLGIPGEHDLKGIYSARDFVGWYNGLPEHAALAPSLDSGDEAVIIGQGNVALDVARTLLSDVDVLKNTDMTDYALATLSKNSVKRVRVVGRRGPMQVCVLLISSPQNIDRIAYLSVRPLLLSGKFVSSSTYPPSLSSL